MTHSPDYDPQVWDALFNDDSQAVTEYDYQATQVVPRELQPAPYYARFADQPLGAIAIRGI